MVTADFYRVIQFLILVWTAGLIILKGTNAQHTNYRSDSSLDPSYSVYQQSEYPRDCTEVHDSCPSSNSSEIYYIKPDGYPEPLEVYCDVARDSFGWTTIHRRHRDGIISFNRDWNSYKNGFGFLSNEYWIGNEILSYLTNQKNYQLLIEMSLSNGSTISVSYNNFRVSDEFSEYKLFSATQYSGTADNISWCPSNMVYGNCTCGQRLCRDPRSCRNTCTEGQSEGCICPEGFHMDRGACVLARECGCYVSEKYAVISEGDSYVNSDCTMVAVCSNGQLTLNGSSACSAHAVCGERDGERRCYCYEGFTGDGELCELSHSTDCMGVYNAGDTNSGVYTIRPANWPRSPFDVYCNMADGGGWTVFQRRKDGDVDFYLEWDSYSRGFGDVADEHWLGNEQLYYLTNQRNYQLRIDLIDRRGLSFYATFSSFGISNETDNYRLSDLGSYSGTSGDALSYQRGSQFSTKDRDNDVYSSYHCARDYHGAWWHRDCHYLWYSNLNGGYHASGWSSIYWWGSTSAANIEYTEMRIRPV